MRIDKVGGSVFYLKTTRDIITLLAVEFAPSKKLLFTFGYKSNMKK